MWKVVIKFQQDSAEGKHKNEFDQDGELKSSDEDNQDNETIFNVEILPELSVFCDYVEKFANEFKFTTGAEEKYQKLIFNHCIILLLEIVQLNDLGDEVGRGKLKALMKKILTEYELSEHSIKEIAHVVELMIGNIEERIGFFNEVVNENMKLGTPCEYNRQAIIEDLISKADVDTKLKATSLKMEMMELKEQESMFVDRKQYAEAQNVSEKCALLYSELVETLLPLAEASDNSSQSLIENLSVAFVGKKITPAEILKNLRICYFAITTKGIKSLTPDVMKIYKEFVSYHLDATDILTRIWALQTATAYSLLYDTMAKDVFMLLKAQVFKSNNVQVWETTIRCVIDLLLRYSIAKMEQHDDTNQDLSINTSNRSKKGGRTLYTEDGEDAEEMDIVQSIDVIKMLLHVMDNSSDIKILKAATIGFCKLILHGQYCSRDLMSRFMIYYFNPATDPELNQLLGIFFEAIVRKKKQELLHDALIPTLVTLLEAPYDSPLREVKQETVVKYVVGATRPVFCSNGLNLHNTLGLKMIMLMKDNPDNKDIFKVFSKELLVLEIGDDPLLKKDMLTHLELLLSTITVDVRTRKNLIDFRNMLNGTYRPSLKFSSTAATLNDNENEDVDEENEDEAEDRKEPVSQNAEDFFQSSDIMDISVSNVDMKPAVVNVTMLSMSKIPENDESTLVESPNVTMIDKTQLTSPASDVKETDLLQNIEDEESPPQTQNIEIPATPKDEEENSDSDDENNETVRERITLDNTDEDLDVPETPETPKSSTRSKRAPSNKRQLELSRQFNASLSSPMRKNPRNTVTPKVIETTRKTPAQSEVKSTPTTPKTPRLGTLQTSTPQSDRVTRKQEKELIALSSRLTRSASKKINVDPSTVTEKIGNVKKSAKSNEKAVKKTMIPKAAPVKALVASQPAQPVKTAPATVSTATSTRSTKPETGKSKQTRGRAANAAAKGKTTRQRPRWQ